MTGPGYLRNPAVRRAVIAAQLVVVPVGLAALFYLLVQELPLIELREAALVVAVSFVLALFGYGLFGVRLARVLEAFSIGLARATLWRIHLSSLFYYFFLPAGIGYDFSKIAKIAFQVPQEDAWRVTGAVAAERVVGGAGVYLLLLGTVPFTQLAADSRLEWLTPPPWLWALLLAGGVLAFVLVMLGASRGGFYRCRPLLPAVIVSAEAHLLVAAAIWFVGQALAIPVSFPEVVVALAATLLLQLVPVNLLGVTLGEVAAVTVYLAYGLDKPEALLLATVAYSHRLVSAMLGGVVECSGAIRAMRHGGAWRGPGTSARDDTQG